VHFFACSFYASIIYNRRKGEEGAKEVREEDGRWKKRGRKTRRRGAVTFSSRPAICARNVRRMGLCEDARVCAYTVSCQLTLLLGGGDGQHHLHVYHELFLCCLRASHLRKPSSWQGQEGPGMKPNSEARRAPSTTSRGWDGPRRR
jgi:hypothetical protein